MGNSICQRLFRRRVLKIIFLGLYGSGKTSTLYRMKLGNVMTTLPDKGLNAEILEYKNVNLSALDLEGRKGAVLYRHYYLDAHGLVFLIDSNDKERFEESICKIYRFMSDKRLQGIPLLIIANKQDLPGALSVDEIRDKLEPEKFKDRAWSVFGASAIYGENISQTGLIEALIG